MNSAPQRQINVDVGHVWPFGEMLPLNARLGQVFGPAWHPGPTGDYTPPDVVEETDEAFRVELDLPGVAKDDIAIEVTGRRVVIHGKRAEKPATGVLRHSTRVFGTFAYELSLPVVVDETAVSARLADGVLVVRLPKAKTAKTTRVTIT